MDKKSFLLGTLTGVVLTFVALIVDDTGTGLCHATRIFKKISTENALEYLASGKGFILDRLRLDI